MRGSFRHDEFSDDDLAGLIEGAVFEREERFRQETPIEETPTEGLVAELSATIERDLC